VRFGGWRDSTENIYNGGLLCRIVESLVVLADSNDGTLIAELGGGFERTFYVSDSLFVARVSS